MVYTFKYLRDQVLQLLDETGETGTEQLVKDAMNQAHQRRCLQHAWPWMLSAPESFTTVPGQAEYTLNYELHAPLYFRGRTSRQFLQIVPKRNVDSLIHALDPAEASGAPRVALWGLSAVAAQPQAAGPVTILSSSGLDTGATYQVVVKGETAANVTMAEVLTPSGATPVTGSVAFERITALTKAGSWNGTLTLRDSGTNTLLTLLPWEMGRQYPVLRFFDVPTVAEPIDYVYYRQPLVLINDYDIPEIPGAAAQVLVYDTLLQMSTYMQDIAGRQIDYWDEMARRYERQLYQGALEGSTLNAEPGYIRDLD